MIEPPEDEHGEVEDTQDEAETRTFARGGLRSGLEEGGDALESGVEDEAFDAEAAGPGELDMKSVPVADFMRTPRWMKLLAWVVLIGGGLMIAAAIVLGIAAVLTTASD